MSNENSTEQVEEFIKQELFESVPQCLAVIDDQYKIVKANSIFEEYFGAWRDKYCYEVYKRNTSVCKGCPAEKVFHDGEKRVSDETGTDRNGRVFHYVIKYMPIKNAAGKAQYILHLSHDVTERRQQRQEHNILFDRAPNYISVIDRDFRIIRANRKFRKTFGEGVGKYCYQVCKKKYHPCMDCPAALTFQDGKEHVSQQVGISRDDQETHYVVTSAPLSRGKMGVEHVIEIMTDITETKKLEKEKLEAERLAAVGQTVAGLAHTIKNLLMGLEGGMYMVDTGIRNGNASRITKGWDVLQRNFNKTTDLVRGFLSFAKGRLPELQMIDPNSIAENIVELYQQTAEKQGVTLEYKPDRTIAELPIDPDGIEACLTNLVSNGIDAALLREQGGGKVEIRTREKDDQFCYEVVDNGIGIDVEVKQKIFTTFFTTKGGKGTGLGLLTTRKIIQEHGGRIEFDSEKGKGSTFRICLPRTRLEEMAKEIAQTEENVGDVQ